MTEPILVSGSVIAVHTYLWFRDNNEWPTPRQMHEFLSAHYEYPLEYAEVDVLAALDAGDVYGLPSVVAMRHGEALGDWRDPLPDFDAGFRLALYDETWNGFKQLRGYVKAAA